MKMTKLLATLLYAAVFVGRSSVHAYNSILEQEEAGIESNNLKGTTQRELKMSYMNGGNSKIGNYFEKYISIYDRCCVPEFVLGGSRGDCKCPVRTAKWWIFDWYSKWEAKCESSITAKSSIVALASSNDDFSTLVTLLSEYPDLVDALSKPGTFTVFAPTNAAFDEITSTVATLTEDQIKEVLMTHVLGSVVKEADLSNGAAVDTLAAGEQVTVTLSDGKAFVSAAGNNNGAAEITATDLQASNGVVHVIDKVLIPDLN
mmetsp:Transcript_36346/g.87695  ORF Transcript_36346/g.87695 Transcript_36346/m.87695 type:complete len:260 (+) Transcript_36346:255-1034(+)